MVVGRGGALCVDFFALSVCLSVSFMHTFLKFIFVCFVSLSFDGSGTLIKVLIFPFDYYQLVLSAPIFFPPGYSGIPIHPLACLELEASSSFSKSIPTPPLLSLFLSSVSSVTMSQNTDYITPILLHITVMPNK